MNDQLKDIERHLVRELSELDQRHGKEIAVERYKALQAQLDAVQKEREERMKSTPPPIVGPLVNADTAMRQVGVMYPRDQQLKTSPNGEVYIEPQGILRETRKWHIAMAKVFEYIEAQLNMDLFKDDPKAKQIFEQWMVKGLQSMHKEADPNRRF
jgi:hypothetical protein